MFEDQRLYRNTLVVLLLFVAFACAPRQSMKSAELLSTPNLLIEAHSAWDAKQYDVAELHYTKLLERADLVQNELPIIYTRLAESALRNGHYHQARIALEKWANMEPSALNDLVWEQTYLDTMSALGKNERLQNHLHWLLRTASVPWATKTTVSLWYTHYFQERGDFEQALDVLASFYSQSPDTGSRIELEHAYLSRLQEMDNAMISDLISATTATTLWQFPYALVDFEHNIRLAEEKTTWSMAWRELQNIVTNADLADVSSLQSALAEREAEYGIPRIGLALALPLTGPYGKVGVKVLRGAGLAQWQLAQEGVDIDLRVINTAEKGWYERLDSLPSHITVVGGPLRVAAFKELSKSTNNGSMLQKRAFFSFLSSLGEMEEGKDAWRFFSSRNDEVRSLVKLAVDQLGIKDLAIFYPEEKYGRTMAETFYNESSPLGGRIRGMQSYPSRTHKKWGSRVEKLLDVPDDFSDNKDVPLEQPDFGAVFIPDGWRQAQTLLPNFFFYEGDQLVFLGPGLWSRALDDVKDIDAHYYRLAVCPGAWWDHSDGGQQLQSELTDEGLGKADFWVALGYDFIRFAGRLGSLPPQWSSLDVNERIQSAQNFEFSMAPITWDNDGIARQELFLFTPIRSGKELVDVKKMAARVAKAKARREMRIKAYKKRIRGSVR